MALENYSKALLEVARAQDQLEIVLSDVRALSVLDAENKLSEFFGNPAIAASDKQSVFDTLQENLSALTKNFMHTLSANGRLSRLTEILSDVKMAADKAFKVSDIVVTSVVALTDAQRETVSALTKKKFDLNDVTLTNTVDKTILGGFIINGRGKIIDASIKTQLAKIAQEIH
ncbi:MAG: F0F1 ATP synthase subunit delta [Streptococcaceae bacterium]|jgi:F-type H+-transporting ATPase subunit delta|nr:F0F1 ATP synthase subunit delta [Streptococcaceae bacterium]